jgi:hypothetical protein
MKKLIPIILMAIVCLSTVAQSIKPPIDSLTNKISYQEVIQLKGDKATLYDKGLNWYAMVFKSANDAIQIRDKDGGKIVGKLSIMPDGQREGYVNVNVTLLFKDNKCKYIFTDLYYQGTGEFKPWGLEEDPSIWKVNMTKGAQKRIKGNTFSTISTLIGELKKYMTSDNKQADF